MPCSTAGPRGGGVGRAKVDLVSSKRCNRRMPSRIEDYGVFVLLFRSLCSPIREWQRWFGGRQRRWPTFLGMRPMAGDEGLEARSGVDMLGSDWHAQIWSAVTRPNRERGRVSWLRRRARVKGEEGRSTFVHGSELKTGGGTARVLLAGWQSGDICNLRFCFGSSLSLSHRSTTMLLTKSRSTPPPNSADEVLNALPTKVAAISGESELRRVALPTVALYEEGVFEEREDEVAPVEPPEEAKIFVGNLLFDVDSERRLELSRLLRLFTTRTLTRAVGLGL